MTDNIATLGLAVDSRQVTQATGALNALTAAAKPAAVAADNLTKSHGGLNAQSQAAFHSVRSLVEALASGQPVTMALSQQINHLSFAASGPGGLTSAFKSAAGAILGMLSPATLVVGGLAAVAVGSLLAVNSIAKTEKAFDDAAHAAGTNLAAMRALASAAAFKGIDNSDFLKASDKFASDIYDAKNNMGTLGEFLRANGKSATDFQGTLETVADLIKNAGSDQERLHLLQQAGLPATMDWVRFLSQGAEGIKQATAEATKFGDVADEALVAKARAFDEAWAKATTNLATYLKGAFVGGLGYIDQIGNAISNILMKTGVNVGQNMLTDAFRGGPTASNKLTAGSNVTDFYSKVGSAAPFNAGPKGGTTVDPTVLQRQIALQQQALGIYGQTITSEEAVRQVELSVQAARLQGVTVDQSRIEVLKRLTAEQNNGVAAIKQQIDAEKVNAATVGMAAGETAEYTAVQNALNKAKQEGRTLSDSDVAAIKANAAALGTATKNTDNLKFAFDGLVQGPMETFTAQIAQGATAMQAFQQAGLSALNSLAKKLADMAAQNLWGAAFGGSSGTGGLLGSLFGIGGGAPGVSSTGAINGAFGPTSVGGAPLTFDKGGYTGPGGKFEPAGIVHRGEYVFDAVSVNRIGLSNLNSMRGYAAGGYVGQMHAANSNSPVMVNAGDTVITIQGSADQTTLAVMRQELDRRDAAFHSNVVRAVRGAKSKRQL